jgi:hypothetical protein
MRTIMFAQFGCNCTKALSAWWFVPVRGQFGLEGPLAMGLLHQLAKNCMWLLHISLLTATWPWFSASMLIAEAHCIAPDRMRI